MKSQGASHFAFVVFLVSAAKTEIFRFPCKKDAVFKLVKRNSRLDASIASTTVAQTLSICAKNCIDISLCKSFNYNADSKSCEALSGSRMTVGDAKLLTTGSWKHYEPVEKQVKASNIILTSNNSISLDLYLSSVVGIGARANSLCAESNGS